MALRSVFTTTSRSLVLSNATRSFPLFRIRPLLALSEKLLLPTGGAFALTRNGVMRSFSTNRTASSLNDPSPNWSNRPPKETILLDGCDFEHWLVVVDAPDPNLTRDEIIQSYIATLGKVLPSDEDPKFKIYSVSTKHYFAFGALVSEELSYKLKEIPGVRWVLPDSYLDVKNKDYGGEPVINGEAVPYDPKYHEEWVRNNARANERNRRNDRPRNNDRSRNFERRRENMQQSQGSNSPPSSGSPPVGNFAGPPRNNSYQGPPPGGYQGSPSNAGGYSGGAPQVESPNSGYPGGAPQVGSPNSGYSGGAPQVGNPNGGYPGGAPQVGNPNGGYPGGVPQAGSPNGGYPGGAPQAGSPNGGYPGGAPQAGSPNGGYPGGAPQVGGRGYPSSAAQVGSPGAGYQGMPSSAGGSFQGMSPPPFQGGPSGGGGFRGMSSPPPMGGSGGSYQGTSPPQGGTGGYQVTPGGYQGTPPLQGRPSGNSYQGLPPPPQGGPGAGYQGMSNNNPSSIGGPGGYQGSTSPYQGGGGPGSFQGGGAAPGSQYQNGTGGVSGVPSTPYQGRDMPGRD
ncbi:hypothetical protein ZOSMA_440G00030 [Zostera marina]|uniref:MORF/ORRM1/DAG-like MORF domain-containing protein n=1 Tax=Zostera marina TaxID=29655 RepID=A0A0K9P3J7_ZOSMR|nr:hypothetical protein ZOSMA_440G00030 [Zostera marina]